MARYKHGNQRGCLRDTRENILKEIELWVEDFSRPPIFWLNGPTGIGKSAIAQSVVEWCDAHGKTGLFFSSSHDANDHNNPHSVFPTAIQLAQKHPEIRPILVALLRSNPDVVYESPYDQVEKLIVKPLKSANIPTVIVIDALEEWIDDAPQSAVFSAVEHWVKEIPEVKFLITGRSKPRILAGSHLPILNGLTDVFSLHDGVQDRIDNDIRIFLKHRLSGLANRKELDNWPTDAQLDQLRDRADGLFVYAVATVKFLDHKQTPTSEKYAIIAHSPDDTIHEGTVEGVHRGLSLDYLCISILQGSFKNNDDEDDTIVRSVLAIMVLATYPLPPSAIADLSCSEVGEVVSILSSITSLLRLHEDPNRPVRPFHKLLSDLLTSSTRCADKRFYISPGKYHSEIALNCLRLMNETLEGGLSLQNDTAHSEVTLKYACAAWHVHLAQAREDVATLISSLRHFLEEKSGMWLWVLGAPATTTVMSARENTTSWLREVHFVRSNSFQCLRALY